MSQDQMLAKIYNSVLSVEASQEQIVQRLESIDKRLSNIEMKMSKVEKFVALDNADWKPQHAQ